MMIITPTAGFLDPDVEPALSALGLKLVANTVGQPDVIQALSFEDGEGTTVRYLFEPELEIPVVTIEGASESAVLLKERIAARVQHMNELQAAIAYDGSASIDVKVTLLRVLSAHGLERVSEAMLRVTELAARDPSPFVRIGVAQMLQYAHDTRIADVVRNTVAVDRDPDVRDFASGVLARFDTQPISAARSETVYLVFDEPFDVQEESLLDRLLAAADETGDDFVEDARQQTATQTWTRFLNEEGDASITLWEDREARVRYVELQFSSRAKTKKVIAAFRRHFATVDHNEIAKQISISGPDEAIAPTLFFQLAYSAPTKVPRSTVRVLTAALASPTSARRQGAATAIGTLGFGPLEAPLRAALSKETAPAVRDAMERALRIFK